MKIGFFDLGVIQKHVKTVPFTIEETINCAKYAEELGFSKYWIGEHHSPETAWRATPIILTLLAGSTESIQIGAAGVLARYHNAVFVAQDFKLLNSLFPQRIDLGFSKSHMSPVLLNYLGVQKEIFDLSENIERTKEMLNGPSDIIPTDCNENPELWMLGSSLESFKFALEKGLNFCLSLCHTEVGSLDGGFVQNIRNLRNSERFKNFKFGLLITFLVFENQSSAAVSQAITLILNFSGQREDINSFFDAIYCAYSPDILLMANIYEDTQLKFSNMKVLKDWLDQGRY